MLVEHHIKYKEIHGVDETVWMEKGKHHALHDRLRRDGKCNIPVKKLRQIASIAHKRTDRYKEYLRTRPKKSYESNRVYARNHYKTLTINSHLSHNIRLKESIRYNTKTNKIYVSVRFEATGKHKLYIMED